LQCSAASTAKGGAASPNAKSASAMQRATALRNAAAEATSPLEPSRRFDAGAAK
jgi:hypothetical protein